MFLFLICCGLLLGPRRDTAARSEPERDPTIGPNGYPLASAMRVTSRGLELAPGATRGGWGKCTKCPDGTLCCRGKICKCRNTPAGLSCGCMENDLR